MENSKTRFLIPLALCAVLLVGASSAFGQAAVTFEVFSTPTFVINIGRAEVLGAVRIRATNAPVGGSFGTTAQFLYLGVGCDNDTTNGVAITVRAGFATAAISSVSNTSAGCVVAITIPAQAVAIGDFIEVGGVRGRVDLSTASTAGTVIQCRLSATPSGSALYTAPTVVDVAISAVGRSFSIRTGNQAFCGALNPSPRVRVTEGFNGAFVQHVTGGASAVAPSNAVPGNVRAAAGATNNTRVNIAVTNLPAGVTLTWPLGVDNDLSGNAGATFFAASTATTLGAAAGGAILSRLERITADATATTQVYDYVTADQGASDINTERFSIIPTVTLPTTLVIGSSQVAVTLTPPLVTNDATSITRSTFGIAATSSETVFGANKPRFNDTPSTGDILTISPCTTSLLFPFVAGGAGFDTGMAIANTSKDPFTSSSSSFLATAPQSGTCTLTGWPAATGTPAVAFTTPSVAAGATFLTTLNDPGNTAFNGFIGYIIARCNFQYGHGFAFIVDNFGVGPPRIAHGYVALVIPDPIVLAGALGTPAIPVGRLATTCQGNGVLCIQNLGEGLTQ